MSILKLAYFEQMNGKISCKRIYPRKNTPGAFVPIFFPNCSQYSRLLFPNGLSLLIKYHALLKSPTNNVSVLCINSELSQDLKIFTKIDRIIIFKSTYRSGVDIPRKTFRHCKQLQVRTPLINLINWSCSLSIP